MNYFNVMMILIFAQKLPIISSSEGDRSPFYQNCIRSCMEANCTKDGVTLTKRALKNQDTGSWLLRWGCRDECQYQCMWRTVQGFQERGYEMPKFHGKWPFVRLLGVQEPASVFASLLNMAANIYMYTEMVSLFPKTVPLVLFWRGFAMVCMNTWLWSTIFHVRDTPFTEFMDYACALAMVMGLFVAAIVRVFHRRKKLTCLILVVPVVYFVEHVRYLYTGNIDYEYNIAVNVFFGVFGSVIWLLWSLAQYAAGRRYVWRMIVFTILSGAALSLEILDFPPKYHAWDAHALWHLCTAPLPLIFYRFVIDDLHHLQSSRYIDKEDLKVT